jgi:predicted Rossmann-fold nucleotide-binding protein
MEAANLGALVADTDALDHAVRRLAAVPGFRPSITEWARLAMQVRAGLRPRDTPASIGIPTWFYGHEPPNVFCDAVAKYFSNAIREDGLLARCTGGLVVLEGAAGTVQEVFQAVTPLYYASGETPLPRLVLVGHEYWTDTVPVWAAIRALGQDRGLADAVHLVDSVEEAAAVIVDGLPGSRCSPVTT